MPNDVGGISVANNNLANSALFNLDKNQAALGKLVTQLSSGLRINSAADDPSGLVISTNLQTQVNGFDAAVQNVQDATNAANVADGALASITSILQRMRTLAIEASSDITSATDKQNLETEIAQLTLEVNRIAQNTNFNGVSLLDGSHAGSQPQTDAAFNITSNSSVGTPQGTENPVAAPTLNGLGTETETVSGLTANASYNVDFTITAAAGWTFKANGSTLASGGPTASNFSGTAKANASGDIQLQLTSGNAIASSITLTPLAPSGSTPSNLVQSVSISTSDAAIVDGTLQLEVAQLNETQQSLVVNFFTSSSGIGANIANITLTGGLPASFAYDGVTVTYSGAATIDVGLTSFIKITQFVTAASNPTEPALSFQSGADEGSVIQVGLVSTAPSTLRISNLNVATTGSFAFLGAEDAIGQIDNALNIVNTQRAQLGAVIARLQVDSDNDNVASVNLQSSESSIRDLNVGEATTDYNKEQILIQIGTTVLAQSNTNAQTVLGLFR